MPLYLTTIYWVNDIFFNDREPVNSHNPAVYPRHLIALLIFISQSWFIDLHDWPDILMCVQHTTTNPFHVTSWQQFLLNYLAIIVSLAQLFIDWDTDVYFLWWEKYISHKIWIRFCCTFFCCEYIIICQLINTKYQFIFFRVAWLSLG